MSGDVQPRKRKDKKKKRDDDESSHGVHLTKMGSEDVHLHVQHDHGTGGHWCAKIIFFSLMTILLGLVALIILENRGLSDLDTPLSESRFSNYFDGWVEEHRPDEHGHDAHNAAHASAEEHDDHDDDHDEPYEEEEDRTGEDDEEGDEHGHDDEDEDDGNQDDEDDDEQQDEDEDEATAEAATAEDEDNDDDDNNNDDDDNDDDDNNNDDDDEADNDEDNETENTEEATYEQTVEDDGDEDDADADEDEQVTQEEATAEDTDNADDEDNTQENDDNNDDNDNDDDGDDDEEAKTGEDDDDGDDNDNDEDMQNDMAATVDDEDDDDNDNDQKTNEDNDDEDDDDDDADADGDSNVVDNDAEELALLQEKARRQAAEANNNADPSAEDDDNKADNDDSILSWASSLAGKIGVGVALAFVARILLLRKNPNASDEPPPEVIMRRRLTIAAPEDDFPTDEQPPPFLDDDEYVEEEVIIEEEIEYVGDDEIPIEHDDEHDGEETKPYVPETFEQLNAMYRSSNYEETPIKSTPLPQSEPQEPPAPKPKPFAPISQRFKERFEEPPKTTTTTSSDTVRKATAPVFTAPPPPPLHEANIQHTAPASNEIKPSSSIAPTKNNESISTNDAVPSNAASAAGIPEKPKLIPDQELSKSEPTKREITHDEDYQPDDEDIDYEADEQYDDEEYINDEEESSLEGDDEEDDEISDVDDSELMNRLEAKYGKLDSKDFESDEDPEDPTWTQIKAKESGGGGPQAHDDDFDSFERELREANEELMRENHNAALKAFTLLCQKYPDQPRVFLGKAQSLDQLAEKQRSNRLLHEAIESYKRYLAFDEMIVDDTEYRNAAERCIERMRFMGDHMQTLPIHNELITRFPLEAGPRNQLAVTHLLVNHLTDAKRILQETLRRWPNDGFAQVHYGFVLKQLDQDYENAVVHLHKGIQSDAEGTQDGRFYFNLGDALQRLGRQSEALEIYKRGAQLDLFPSAYQRSLYNEPNLRAQPIWSKEETTYNKYLHKLEQNWLAIRDEGLSVLSKKGYFEDESENLRDRGEWQQFELFARGQRQHRNCQKAPITCGMIQEFTAASSCRRGQVKFSVLHPNTHVWPHCGPSNCRLRAHLGLVVPDGTQLRVADQYRSWKEGEFIIFDDSFEHEVWHNGTSLRLVLIVDIWHPDLSEKQRSTLSSI